MRHLAVIILSILSFSTVFAQQGKPKFLNTFKPEERVHDFGRIYEKDGKVNTVFTFTNESNTPVVINDVNTWCGCMVAEYTKKAVRKGEMAAMRVELDPDHKSGSFIKQVVLLLNDGKNYARVWVKADIVPMEHPVEEDFPYSYGYGLYMSHSTLVFPNYGAGQDFAISLHLANDTNKPMRITFTRKPNNTVLKMPALVMLKPKERRTIKVSYHYYKRHEHDGYIMLTPVVNGKSGRQLKVRWNGRSKFRMG